MKSKSPLLALPAFGALSAFLALGCNSTVDEPGAVAATFADTASEVFALKPAETPDTVANLPADSGGAPTGLFTYYSLKTGAVVAVSDSATNKWDLAFKGTVILVNGGAHRAGNGGAIVLKSPAFDSVTAAPATGYGTDTGTTTQLAITTGTNNGWYHYTGTDDVPNFTIFPRDSVVIVLKTAEGKYAKVQILSYYNSNPAIGSTTPTATSKVYTFRYFLQTDGSRNLKPNATPYTFYSLRTHAVVTDTTAGWDLGFQTTNVKINGQSQLLNSGYDALTQAPAAGYGSGNLSAWYNYNPDTHVVSPLLGIVFALKTTDGKYAKVQFLSYYHGAPAVPDGSLDTPRYYKFRYALQANGSRTFP